jgi:hypothetical protein
MAARAGFILPTQQRLVWRDARILANEVMYKVAQGKDPAAERRAERSADIFEELATRYCKYSKRKNKSWEQAANLVTSTPFS